MSSKCLLFIVVIVTAFKAQSQTLLNADLSKIKKDAALQGGGLKRTFIEKDVEKNGTYKKVIFSYPMPPEGNDSLIKTTFCLTLDNRCFKYYEEYWGKDLADKKIDYLKKYYPGLKKVQNKLKWVDNSNKFDVQLIPRKLGDNQFASVYILKIEGNQH